MSITRRRSAAAIDGCSPQSAAIGRTRVRRRLGRAALIVAAGSAALALAGPMALRPFVDTAEAAVAASDVPVAFVLDFGTGTTPVVGCVSVPASDNRYDALAAFAKQKGMALPGYDSNGSGLLCSINAVPSTGCGQIVQGGYIYWSYFTGGTSGWTYASSGASGGVTNPDVEGWRFQNPGTGKPVDPPPRSAAQYDSICVAGTVTTSTIPVTIPTDPRSGPGTLPGNKGAAPAPGGSNLAGSTSTTTPAPSTTTTKAPSHPSTTSTTSTTSTASSTSDTPPTGVSVPSVPIAALGVADRPARASGPGAGPLIIGGLLITALGIAAFVRWRKRPRTP